MEYSQPEANWVICVRVALPLGGFFGWLLSESEAAWLIAKRKELIDKMSAATPAEQLLLGVSWMATEPFVPVPGLLAARFDTFLREPQWSSHVLYLTPGEAVVVKDMARPSIEPHVAH